MKKITEEKDTKNNKEFNFPKELQNFLEAGVHFGHKKSVVHPGMLPYIFGVRNSVHIIDITKTKQKLDEALEFLKNFVEEGKIILFVGTKVPLREMTKQIAEETNMPYVVNRWFGGTLTNWDTIKTRIEYLEELIEKTKSEDWKKYTKHERLKMKKEIEKLEANFGGIQNMKKLPDALVVTDGKENALAIKEAIARDIPTVGIVDTNVDPRNLNYPIPANDDSISSVKLILSKIEEAIVKNKSASPGRTLNAESGKEETKKEVVAKKKLTKKASSSVA